MKEIENKAYQTVSERISIFYAQYPDGRIITEPITMSDGALAFKALGYRTYVEQINNTPCASGWSKSIDKSSRTFSQFEFEELETSAIGRMIKNAGLVFGEVAPTIEEMVRSEKVNKKTKREDLVGVQNGQ